MKFRVLEEIITFRKFVTEIFCILKESVCNTIHHLLEYMGSTFKYNEDKVLEVLTMYSNK